MSAELSLPHAPNPRFGSKSVFECELKNSRTIELIDDLQHLEPRLRNQVAGLSLADSAQVLPIGRYWTWLTPFPFCTQ